jgi:hypothetical protein
VEATILEAAEASTSSVLRGRSMQGVMLGVEATILETAEPSASSALRGQHAKCHAGDGMPSVMLGAACQVSCWAWWHPFRRRQRPPPAPSLAGRHQHVSCDHNKKASGNGETPPRHGQHGRAHMVRRSLSPPSWASSGRRMKWFLMLSYSGNWMTTCMTPMREGPSPLQPGSQAGRQLSGQAGGQDVQRAEAGRGGGRGRACEKGQGGLRCPNKSRQKPG